MGSSVLAQMIHSINRAEFLSADRRRAFLILDVGMFWEKRKIVDFLNFYKSVFVMKVNLSASLSCLDDDEDVPAEFHLEALGTQNTIKFRSSLWVRVQLVVYTSPRSRSCEVNLRSRDSINMFIAISSFQQNLNLIFQHILMSYSYLNKIVKNSKNAVRIILKDLKSKVKIERHI
jgi:hypothetical protein